MQEALRTGTPRRVQYRLLPKPGADERWLETLATVVVENGVPVKLLGICRDVSDRARMHRELRIRASQQEAVARLGAQALTELGLQRFFDDSVKTIAATLDVELVKILELVPGDAELLLRAGAGWRPGFVGTALVSTDRDSQAGFTLAAGGPVIVENLATESRFSGQPLLHQHGVVSGLTIPIAGRDGRTYGVLGVHTTRRRSFSENDVSFLAAVANMIAGAIQRRQLDQRHELMIRELRHRSGNLFAQLLALFSQTAKTSKNIAELVPKYEARVLALANAHRLITESGWRSASLTEILNPLLAPYLDRVDAVRARCLSRARSDLRAERGGARAGDQCQQIRQPLGARRPGRGGLVGATDRARVDAAVRLEGAQRPAPQTHPPPRLRLQAHPHRDRAPAQRQGAAVLRTERHGDQADDTADPRALAGHRRRRDRGAVRAAPGCRTLERAAAPAAAATAPPRS